VGHLLVGVAVVGVLGFRALAEQGVGLIEEQDPVASHESDDCVHDVKGGPTIFEVLRLKLQGVGNHPAHPHRLGMGGLHLQVADLVGRQWQ
jgi:hypothetical protein